VNAHFIQTKSQPQNPSAIVSTNAPGTVAASNAESQQVGTVRDEGDEEEMVVDEDQLYDLEDKKVLNKRRKRTAKVEESN
jgi:hypothetical protein